MHGVKQEQPKLEDTNLAKYGGKEHHELKKGAALTEAAWKGCGQKPGVQVWRINKFKVESWDEKQYGSFFGGDSYIVLDTYKGKDEKGKETDKLIHDIHFWLGKKSTQDERGSAAYKTVELDDLFDGSATQFRQTQGHESKEFLAMFGGTIHVMEGGADSGFHHVKPEEYKPRLFEVVGLKTAQVKVQESPLEAKSLHNGSAFILDGGLEVFQFNPAGTNMWEKAKAKEFLLQLVDQRNGRAKHYFLDGTDDTPAFWKFFGGKKIALPASPRPEVKTNPKHHTEWHPTTTKKLTRAEVKGTHVTFAAVAASPAKVLKSGLNDKGVFIVDITDEEKEHHLYVWVGKDAPAAAARLGIAIGQEYIAQNKLNENTAVRRIRGGEAHKHVLFDKCFDG